MKKIEVVAMNSYWLLAIGDERLTMNDNEDENDNENSSYS